MLGHRSSGMIPVFWNKDVTKMPYSLDLRKRVVDAIHSGMQKKEASKLYNISRQTIYDWLSLEKREGHLNPQTGFQNGHSHGIKDLEAFREYVDLHPDYTQEEMAKHYGVGSSTIGRAMKKIGYSRKKRVKLTPKETKKNEASI
jgi:transposase